MGLFRSDKHIGKEMPKLKKLQEVHAFKFLGISENQDKPQLFQKTCFRSWKLLMKVYRWCLAPVLPAICILMQGDIKTGTICG